MGAVTVDNQLEKVFSQYEGDPSELIPLLQAIQQELGYISREAMTATARFLNIPESTVYGVVTFYAQFYLTRQGRHRVRVCRGTACHVKGSAQIVRAISRRFQVEPGGTTEDFVLSLENVACFGSCALAPVMVVDGRVYGNVTPDRAVAILEELS